jgi:hypothetical protein
VNAMARPPACWTPAVTMTKTETRISTARHELAKHPERKRKVKTRKHTCKLGDVLKHIDVYRHTNNYRDCTYTYNTQMYMHTCCGRPP